MRLPLALGAALVATTMVAYADSNNHRFAFRHDGDYESPDTNNDGWLSRAEASAQADRTFDNLDRNSDGRITDVDHEILERDVEAEVERAMEGFELDMEAFEVEMEGLGEEIERSMHGLIEDNCTTTENSSNGERRITIVCRDENGEAGERHRRVDRQVRVIRNGGDMVVVPPIPRVPPAPPVPHVPPVPHLMFWFGGEDEADLSGDGALSREEFRAQQLRHFDARDANGDGRVRLERPPEPPTPPTPPEPPRRR
jgi:hypothetical protein